jgi:diguanylate cyclase (GGDEF)-like protein
MDSVELWSRSALKSLFVPGGIVLLAACLLIGFALPAASAASVDFYSYVGFCAGILLASRFRSSRVLLALIFLFVSWKALAFFFARSAPAVGPGNIAFQAVSILLPLDLLIIAFSRERGLSFPSIAPKLCLLFVEAVLVAILCRPGQTTGPSLLHAGFPGHDWFAWTALPPFSALVFGATLLILLGRALVCRRPLESGWFWCALGAFLALSRGRLGSDGEAFFATASLVLASCIIENSYVLAYHDELTSLPGRRAFNEALLQLEEPYAIAVVDIDHFKRFNDTHGHETGDEVLRMVASRLARVTGGGQAFRVGGEEFSILFPQLRMKDAVPHLENVRSEIESSIFRVRGGVDRRRVPRGPDRRATASSKGARIRRLAVEDRGMDLSVTVSAGVAEPAANTTRVEDVIRAADKALYRAKQAGRNRVETASSRSRAPRLKRSTA